MKFVFSLIEKKNLWFSSNNSYLFQFGTCVKIFWDKRTKKINLAENDIAIRDEQKQYVFSGGKNQNAIQKLKRKEEYSKEHCCQGYK